MNDDTNIEQVLSRQRLAEPSTDLDNRVLGAIHSAGPRSRDNGGSHRLRIGAWWTTIGAGLAAALAIAALPFLNRGAPETAIDPTAPIAAVSEPAEQIHTVLTHYEPAGLTYLDERTPVRPVIENRVEKFHWIDPDRNARIELEIPRSNVILMSAPVD